MRLAWSTGIAKPSPIEPLCACRGVTAERGDRRVDADQFAVHVHQRAAGVARVDRGVGLDGVEHGVLVLGVAARGDRPVQRADDAGGDGALEAERRADRHDVLADPQIRRRAERDRRQAGDALGLHHRDVAARVGADDGERCACAPSAKVTLVCSGPPGAGARCAGTAGRPGCGHHVVVGQDQPVGGQDDARALFGLPGPCSVSSLTTLGTTLAATCSTEPAGRLAAGTLGAAPRCS